MRSGFQHAGWGLYKVAARHPASTNSYRRLTTRPASSFHDVWVHMVCSLGCLLCNTHHGSSYRHWWYQRIRIGKEPIIRTYLQLIVVLFCVALFCLFVCLFVLLWVCLFVLLCVCLFVCFTKKTIFFMGIGFILCLLGGYFAFSFVQYFLAYFLYCLDLIKKDV